MDPLGEFFGNRLLWNVFNPRFGNRWLRNVFNPRSSNRSLSKSLFNGCWLDDLNVFNGVGWGNNSLDGLVLFVFNLVPSRLDGGIIVEGIGIIEVLI